MPLRALAALTDTPLFTAIRSNLLRKNGYVELLQDAFYPEAPLFYPDTAGWPAERGWFAREELPADAPGAATVAAALAALGLPPGAPCRSLALHAAYLSGTATPTAVAEALITAEAEARAAAPPLPFFASFDPGALRAAAAASTRRYASKTPLSPLDGVPFGVKDEVDVGGHATSAGTAFLAERRPAEGTVPAVQALLGAGALLAGKTTMHEIGIGTTGLNPAGGTALNPFDPGRHSGGSSSGSAVAVAAGLVPFALGCDGGGSIRIPAALCGAVGLKPTAGRVCAAPGPDLCPTVDVLGPIAATVADCALLYAVAANRGHGEHGAAAPLQPLALPAPLAPAHAAERALGGVTIGVYTPWFDHGEPEVVAACRDALHVLEAAGAAIKEVSIPGIRTLDVAHTATIASEMRACLGPHLAHGPTRRRLNPSTRISLAVADGVTAPMYVNAQRVRRRADADARALFAGQGIDFLATPTTPCAAPAVRPGALAGDSSDLPTVTRLMRYARMANFLGLPAVTVPVGAAGGLPVGLQLIAPAWHEASLLRAAAVLEARLAPGSAPQGGGLEGPGAEAAMGPPAGLLPLPQVHWDLLALACEYQTQEVEK